MRLRDDARRQRDARAVDEPRPDVAALDVGAEPVCAATDGCSWLTRSIASGSCVRHERREQREQHEQHDDADAEPGARVARAALASTRSFMTDPPARAACPAADASSAGDARNIARARAAPNARACSCTTATMRSTSASSVAGRLDGHLLEVQHDTARSAAAARTAKTSGASRRSANTAGPRGVLA